MNFSLVVELAVFICIYLVKKVFRGKFCQDEGQFKLQWRDFVTTDKIDKSDLTKLDEDSEVYV